MGTGSLARFRMLLLLAWRNLFSHKVKNLIVGSIMFFGTFLVVIGTSTVDSIDRGMTRSITSSLAGHLQVYSADAEDDLALFGGGFMGAPNIGIIKDFYPVKQVLAKVPNVKAVVPMGIDVAEFYTATQLDQAIEGLRKAQEKGDTASVASFRAKIRTMAGLMEKEFESRRKILTTTEEIDEQLADIRRAESDAFWQELDTAPAEAIEFLDTKLAPLVDENGGLFMNYVGTDLQLFAQQFDRFELVEGQMVPPGHRGLLMNQKFYEDMMRNLVARDLDELKRELHDRKKKIAGDPLLKNKVARMARQYRRITFQLEPDEADTLSAKLRALMPGTEGNVEELMQAFLTVTDESFDRRYRFFFDEIAPMISLYYFDIGDTVTIRTYTRSGYMKSANVKVWGVFRFKGLEKSNLAGFHNLMDLATFRDLYGYMSEEKREEVEKIRENVGIKDIEASDAEDALFGGGNEVEVARTKETSFDEFANVDLSGIASRTADSTFDPETIDHGVVLNIAVILDDPDKLEESRDAVASAVAGFGLQVVDWQQASGIVGQLVSLVRMVLYVAIFIIFLVALIILNNSMVIATTERIGEIGTMRAIGAQSRAILVLLLLETAFVAVIAGVLGAAAGVGTISWLGTAGIPAPAEELIFLFSGPRLFPTVGVSNVLVALVAVVLVSIASITYPGWIATRVQPVVAMQAGE